MTGIYISGLGQSLSIAVSPCRDTDDWGAYFERVIM